MVEYLPPMVDLIVVGGGAAGFFGAIQAAEGKAGLKIVILEKSSKLLTKVRISGGGRCNVTHHEFNAAGLAGHYPRGEKPLKGLFKKFQASDVVTWFSNKGVPLKVEADGRMFPTTDSSQTIIDCFMNEARRHSIRIEMNCAVAKVEKQTQFFKVTVQTGQAFLAKNILVATGGHPQRSNYQWIEDLGHVVTPLAPSLFTFNDTEKRYIHLMGISVPNASLKIAGTKFSQQGPVLLTHWGLSGPAVIRLSAWAALFLNAAKYEFTVLVNWLGKVKEEEIREELVWLRDSKPKQKVFSNPIHQLPQRLWQTLCMEAEVNESKIWGEVSQRSINKLIENLIRCSFNIKGKTTFKEEFVTCGGVDLDEVNLETMESKKIENLYFAGEVLDIDGETGGFNFQSAWSTAWLAAQSISRRISLQNQQFV